MRFCRDLDEVTAEARTALEHYFRPADPQIVARVAFTLLFLLQQARHLFARVNQEGMAISRVGKEAGMLAEALDDRREAIGDESLERAVALVVESCKALWANQIPEDQLHCHLGQSTQIMD